VVAALDERYKKLRAEVEASAKMTKENEFKEGNEQRPTAHFNAG